MLTKLKVLALGIFLFSSVGEASRIKPPGTDPAVRCSEKGISKEVCDEDRNYAVESRCITPQELREISDYNGCPVCNRRNEYLAWCPLGCFIRGTKILVWDMVHERQDWIAIEEIVDQSNRFKVASIRKEANLNDLKYEFLPIRLTIEGPELEPLVILTTNKRTLGITSTHGVVLANGQLLAAEELRVGDQLLSTDSSAEHILTIERLLTDDLVFNLSVESEDAISHLIFAEGGLVVGDQFLQSFRHLNSTLLK